SVFRPLFLEGIKEMDSLVLQCIQSGSVVDSTAIDGLQEIVSYMQNPSQQPEKFDKLLGHIDKLRTIFKYRGLL
ncbi:hypothetical protein DID76_02900, partial [Candidatus Marinamargulisbacteria bacterium SCGC AG-414-C22]